jgi:hypothetical protein
MSQVPAELRVVDRRLVPGHSRRDHTRHEAPEAGLLTITAEDVLKAADELLAEEHVR